MVSEKPHDWWVAYDATGYPYGFCRVDPGFSTMKQAGREFPDAHRIERVSDAEVRPLFLLHADGRTA